MLGRSADYRALNPRPETLNPKPCLSKAQGGGEAARAGTDRSRREHPQGLPAARLGGIARETQGTGFFRV